ncbi:MAG: hypothetical protein H6718_12925 [Polyangiaceae bacterium]|nr:hypothetical protein [Polyangiaceae bacterium]MCB9606976.1 hypothetical protein [Polyangiaceae bacterium]
MRLRWFGLALSLFWSGSSNAAGTDNSTGSEIVPTVSARCQRVAAPGRVLCEVETELPSGKLEWGDAVVVSTPEFAKPLRARVGPNEASARTPRRLRLPVALVATATGDGMVVFGARGVACSDAGHCEAFRIESRAELHVGPENPAGTGG